LLTAVLPVVPVFGLRTPLEEAQLVERFGEEYREYQRMTARYLPRVRRLVMG
jgi:protein-S-isoprenylcysteine O-methyltransferase Ste14